MQSILHTLEYVILISELFSFSFNEKFSKFKNLIKSQKERIWDWSMDQLGLVGTSFITGLLT
jgi:hypothetical protein